MRPGAARCGWTSTPNKNWDNILYCMMLRCKSRVQFLLTGTNINVCWWDRLGVLGPGVYGAIFVSGFYLVSTFPVQGKTLVWDQSNVMCQFIIIYNDNLRCRLVQMTPVIMSWIRKWHYEIRSLSMLPLVIITALISLYLLSLWKDIIIPTILH